MQQLDDQAVVWKFLRLPTDAPLPIEGCLILEYERVKELLQELVRVIDAQLLKRILLEEFETKDVQYTTECSTVLRSNYIVDALHH